MEYLSSLQQRNKWKTPQENAYEGQLVLIKDENQPPSQWKMGIIVKVHPGKDGYVRAATVRTAHGEYDRTITKLVPLYNDNNNAQAE